MSPKILGWYEDSSGCRSAQIANQEILKKLQSRFSSKTSSSLALFKEVLEDGENSTTRIKVNTINAMTLVKTEYQISSLRIEGSEIEGTERSEICLRLDQP